MDPATYAAYTEALRSSLEADPRVIGLVALGSMAGGPIAPDAFSDHDFFVLTLPGEQERFRGDLSWLPAPPDAPGSAVLVHRETEHGLKVILSDGHLLELAVFDLPELAIARANRYAVLLDRGGVAEAMVGIAGKPVEARSDAWLCGQLLGNLLVGGSRAARGEELSARLYVSAHATRCLLELVVRHVPREAEATLDDLDPFRRVERAYPRLGADLNAALSRPPLPAARALLDLATRELAPRLAEWPSAAADVVRSRLSS